MQDRLTNEQYLVGLKERESDVLSNIYHHFFPGIAKHVLDSGGNRQDAEDIFQEGIVVLFRKAKDDSLQLHSSFYTFFYAVCKRLWLNKRHRRNHAVHLPLSDDLLTQADTDVIASIDQSEQYQLYRSKFQELGADCKRVLQLYFAKTSMHDIAMQMGYSSVGYTKKRKFICKERLMNLIKSDVRYQELT